MFKRRIPFLRTHVVALTNPAIVQIYADLLGGLSLGSSQRQFIALGIDRNINQPGWCLSVEFNLDDFYNRILILLPVGTCVGRTGLANGVDKYLFCNAKSGVNLVCIRFAIIVVTDINGLVSTLGTQNRVESCISTSRTFFHALGIEHGVVIVEVAIVTNGQVFANDALEAKCMQLTNRESVTDVNVCVNELSQTFTLLMFCHSLNLTCGKCANLLVGQILNAGTCQASFLNLFNSLVTIKAPIYIGGNLTESFFKGFGKLVVLHLVNSSRIVKIGFITTTAHNHHCAKHQRQCITDFFLH